jgi:hypothetical protein
MTKHENCPDCEAKLEWSYEPPYQEYAGAKVWGGIFSAECECGWEGDAKGDLEGYNVRENTRGW